MVEADAHQMFSCLWEPAPRANRDDKTTTLKSQARVPDERVRSRRRAVTWRRVISFGSFQYAIFCMLEAPSESQAMKRQSRGRAAQRCIPPRGVNSLSHSLSIFTFLPLNMCVYAVRTLQSTSDLKKDRKHASSCDSFCSLGFGLIQWECSIKVLMTGTTDII